MYLAEVYHSIVATDIDVCIFQARLLCSAWIAGGNVQLLA